MGPKASSYVPGTSKCVHTGREQRARVWGRAVGPVPGCLQYPHRPVHLREGLGLPIFTQSQAPETQRGHRAALKPRTGAGGPGSLCSF